MSRYRSTCAVAVAYVLAQTLLTGCTGGGPPSPESSSLTTLTTRVTTQIPDPAMASAAAAAASAKSVSAAASAAAAKSKAQQSSAARAADASASASQRAVAQQAAERAEQSAAQAAASESAESAAAESAAAQAAAEQSAAEEQSSQQAVSDPVARALEEGWYTPNGNYVSAETAARAIAAGIDPGETVPNYLRCGTICGEGPTSGEVQTANLCQEGILPASECEGIDTQAIIDGASSNSG